MRTRAGSASALKSAAVASASPSERTGAASGAQQAAGAVIDAVISTDINISRDVDQSRPEVAFTTSKPHVHGAAPQCSWGRSYARGVCRGELEKGDFRTCAHRATSSP